MKRMLILMTLMPMFLGAMLEQAAAQGTGGDVCADAIQSAESGVGEFASYELVYDGAGGNGRQILVGTDGDDVLHGGNGADVLCGFGGDDILDGGNGDDILVGGDGNDEVSGANGSDVLVTGEIVTTGHGNDIIDTDGDGFTDAEEVNNGSDPNDPDDSGDTANPTTCPDWANLATTENPTEAFTSEQECIDYIENDGSPTAVEQPQVACPNWESLARQGNPFVAFTSEQECIDYIEGGGTTVPYRVDDGSVQSQTVWLEGQGHCGAVVTISGFDPDTTYTGSMSVYEFTITTDGNGTGSATVPLNQGGNYTATVGGYSSDETFILCSVSV